MLLPLRSIQLGLTCTRLVLWQTQPKDSRIRERGGAVHSYLVDQPPVIGDSGTHLVGITELGHLVSMVKRLEEEGRKGDSSQDHRVPLRSLSASVVTRTCLNPIQLIQLGRQASAAAPSPAALCA